MTQDPDKEVDILRRKVVRERLARLEAERILDDKSLEIYEMNRRLKEANAELDKKINLRTLQLVRAKEAIESKAEQLHISNERFELVMQTSKTAVWEWDINSDTYYYSPYVHEVLPCENNSIEQKFAVLDFIHPEDAEKFSKALAEHINNNRSFDLECRVLTTLGENEEGEVYRWFSFVGSAVWDKYGIPYRMVGAFTDIHERVRNDNLMKRLAEYDHLTNIPNRALFNSKLEIILGRERKNNEQTAVMILDLNGFKEINDSFGHSVGDKVLIEVARRINEEIKGYDCVARLGGDEFGIILDHINRNFHLDKICTQLLEKLALPIPDVGLDISIAAAIGIAVYPKDGQSSKELLINADLAMYQAKNNCGRSGWYEYFSKEHEQEYRLRRQREHQLIEALESDQFTLVYQPEVDLNTGHIIAAEALLRWQHPELGYISPEEFIPIAEENRLIIPIGEWVVDQVCRDVNLLLGSDYSGSVAINLSPVEFSKNDIHLTIQQAMQKHSIKRGQLQIEITERLLLENTNDAKEMLDLLHGLGVSISLDDFGVGYSNLAYLSKLPIDVVKIDRSFISNCTTSDDNLTITEAIIKLVHSLGLKVLAEGIETQQQYSLVRELGCDYGQGHYIARPMEITAFLKQIEKVNNTLQTINVSSSRAVQEG